MAVQILAMSGGLIAALVIGAIVLIGIFWLIGIFNRLVALRNQFKNAFAQIDVQLKRRYDLIPNLVETAKSYMSHEKETLTAVVEARNQAQGQLSKLAGDPGNAEAMKGLMGAEGALGGAMGKLFAVMESYPDLKANQNMIALQEELTSTENRVAFARQGFNDSVMGYNTYRQSFPAVVFAATFGHPQDATLLEFDDAEAIQAAPSVKF